MKDFELKFSGLTVGKHQFNYEATKMFFESFQGRGLESELIHDGKVAFDVELDKKENLLVFDIIYDGKVNVDCDVCLDQLDVEVSGDSRIIGKYSDEDVWGEEDVIYIPSKDHKVDLSEIFYQFIHLSLPAKTVHEEGKCDPVMLEKLKEYNGGEVSSKEESDPRWNTLKDLFKDKN